MIFFLVFLLALATIAVWRGAGSIVRQCGEVVAREGEVLQDQVARSHPLWGGPGRAPGADTATRGS